MATLRFLAKVAVCILAGLCAVGGLILVIWYAICRMTYKCPDIWVDTIRHFEINRRNIRKVRLAILLFPVLCIILFLGCGALCIILFFNCGASWRSIKYPATSSTSAVELFLREYAHGMPTRYSLLNLKKITNNFAEKLGEGGYGVVYKGKLQNGTPIAVKLLDRHRHSEVQFMNEVATIGHVHHVNLVRLLGYCFESFTSALLYEYMPNGSLDRSIFAAKEKLQGQGQGQLLNYSSII